MQKSSSPRLQPKTRMPQTSQRLNTRTTTRPPQVQSDQSSKHRRSSRQRRPSIPVRQHPRTLKLLLPNLLRFNISSMTLEEPLAVAQGLFGKSVRIAGGLQDAVG
jgi:hypothetical protein